jgi:hypothetical protein
MSWIYTEIPLLWVIFSIILVGAMFFTVGYGVGKEYGAKNLDKIKSALILMKAERTNVDNRLEVISNIITDIQKGSE